LLLLLLFLSGRVVGFDCEAHQEGRYRQHFLDAVKEIYPPVYGEDYSIHLAPLLDVGGRQHCTQNLFGLFQNNLRLNFVDKSLIILCQFKKKNDCRVLGVML